MVMSAHVTFSAVSAIGNGTALLRNSTKRNASQSRKQSTTKAFWKKEPPAPPPPPPPEPKGFAKLFGSKKAPQQQQQQVRDVEYVPQETMTDAYARVRKQREMTKKKFEAKEKGGVSLFMFNALSAVNFEEDIEADRGLLKAAKRMGKGEQMSREQYNALQRKVGGTKGGFFGENIFAKGEYLDKGYVETAEEQPVEVLGGPFLGLVLVGVLATTVYVVIQVGQAGAV
tara:strand:+ start:21836 stop:22519 length:684 start_codon:yes stop_codon:yes gene_type:complete